MNFKKNWKRFVTVSRASEGFTLVELIVVIAILAILAGIAVPAYSGYIKKANKAADLQLLGAVNTAFAAAALENGDDVNEVTSAYMPLTGSEGNMTIAISNIQPAEYQEAFSRYFGNTNGTFKVITALAFDPASHCFVENAGFNSTRDYLMQHFGPQIGALQGSAYNNIGAEALLGQVDGVTGMAADMIIEGLSSEGGNFFSRLVYNQDYMENLADMMGVGMDYFDEYQGDLNQLLANSTVFTVAQTMGTAGTRDTITNMLSSGDFSTISGSVSSDPQMALAQAAALYGMYTAFDSDAAANITDFSDVNSLLALKNNDEFMDYLGRLDDPNSDASNDLDGYMAALDMVNGAVTNDSSIAQQVMSGSYSNSQLVDIMNQLMAGNS